MWKSELVNTGNCDYENDDRIWRLVNGNPIEEWRVSEFVSHFAVSEIDVETVFYQFKDIVAYSPVNKTIPCEIFAAVLVSVTTGSLWHFDVLQSALTSACIVNNKY